MNAFVVQPYGPLRTTRQPKPLLTALMEPRDAVHRNDLDLFALTPTATVAHLILRITSEGEFDAGGCFSSAIDPVPDGPGFKGAPAVLNASDASLVNVFAVNAAGQVEQVWKPRETVTDAWPGGWSGWVGLPATGQLQEGLAALNWPDGKLVSVFALGVDGRIHQTDFARGPGGGWRPWTALPNTLQLTSAPAAVNSPDGTLLSVFALGDDRHIHQAVYARGPGGGWRGWTALPGGSFSSAPAVLNSPDGKLLSVFALGGDQRIHQAVYARGPGGGWRPWTPLPDTQKLASAPAAVNSPDGTLAIVVAVGTDGYPYASTYVRQPGGHWGSWTKVPGGEKLASAPALAPRLLYRRSRERVREVLYGPGGPGNHCVNGYFSEVSYGHFHFKEAETTPWLFFEDDPTTARDESQYEFVHAGGAAVEREKGRLVLQDLEGRTGDGFTFRAFAGSDDTVTSDELSALWLYTGGSGGGAYRGVPKVQVPSLTGGVALAGLTRCGADSGVELIAHELAHEALNLDDSYPAMQIRRIAIKPSNNHVFTWFDDDISGSDNSSVCEGTTRQLNRYAGRKECRYPPGRTAPDLVGIGIAKDNHVYAWFRDGFVSAGSPTDLSSYRQPKQYQLAGGRTPDNVIDIEIGANDECYAWYDDGTVSIGTSDDLAQHDGARPFDRYGDHAPNAIIGIGIAANGHVYAWYKDGTVSAGTAHDLAAHLDRYPFAPPPEADSGPGRLSLMGWCTDTGNVPHLDPWTKIKLGWLTPTIVTRSDTYPIHDVETNPEAFILFDPAHGQREYFIVENRRPGSSYESMLAGGGLAIWHIHERLPFPDHQDHWARKAVHLVKPLGLDLLNERDSGSSVTSDKYLWDATDPRRSYDLTADSIPAHTRWDDGSDSGIAIRDISSAGATMSAWLEVP